MRFASSGINLGATFLGDSRHFRYKITPQKENNRRRGPTNVLGVGRSALTASDLKTNRRICFYGTTCLVLKPESVLAPMGLPVVYLGCVGFLWLTMGFTGLLVNVSVFCTPPGWAGGALFILGALYFVWLWWVWYIMFSLCNSVFDQFYLKQLF